MERTVENFIADMLAQGRDWIAIMAVASVVRGGKWHESCGQLLQEMKLMPADPEIARALKDDAIKDSIAKLPPSKFFRHKK